MQSEPVRVSLSVLELTQPIGTFYLGVMRAADLFMTSFADMRDLANRELDLYIGIQRPISEDRIREISAYITNVDATFPTGIILAASSKDVFLERSSMTLSFERRGDVFRILDGQHRIMAFREEYMKDLGGRFELPVMVFVDMDVEDQAQVFATINLAQTKVNRSLAYDLFEFETNPSPQKTAHQVARLLNRHDQSPYKGRIKVLGRADLGGEVLTQAAIVDQVLPLITQNKRADRDLIKKGGWPSDFGPPGNKKTVFRTMWCQKRDEQIGVTMIRYFAAAASRWPVAWNSSDRGVMLARTNGFVALMTLLKEYLATMQPLGESPSREAFDTLLAKVKLSDSDFTTERFAPGSTGQAALAGELRRAVG